MSVDKRVRELEEQVARLGADLRAARLMAKSAEERLAWTTEVLQRVQTLARIGYFAYDLGTRKFEWSDRVFELFGRDPALGPPSAQDFYESIPPEDLQEMRARATALDEGQPLVMEHRVIRGSGEIRWAVTHALIHMGPDEPHRVVGTIQDVTERKNLEEKLQRASKMEAIGRLAGGVAHDFNNMLTAIVSFTEFAREQAPPDSELDEDLGEVLSAASRAAELINRLLAFSRRKSVAPRVISVNDVVRDVARLLERVIGESIDYRMELADPVAPTRIDPGALEQVLVNLALNARDAMPQGGSLIVATAMRELPETPEIPAGNYVCITITDTGHGIAPELRQNIFEPFFTTKGQGGGSGLGLSMCYGLVRQAQGFIRVDSTVGEGSVFTILLPVHQGEAGATDVPERTHQKSPGTERILVVEDDALVREIAVRSLQRVGYEIISADGPVAALDKLQEIDGLDLLLSDVVMPDMNGRDLAVRVRAKFPDVPVLFMSGYMEDALASVGVLPDGVRLLQKPYTPDRLAEAVRDTLDGKFESGVYQ